jgi:hypothetical protein
MKNLILLFAVVFSVQAQAITPMEGPWNSLKSKSFFLGSDEDTYQIGSEWGKKPITTSLFQTLTPSIQRMAKGTAKVRTATGFYLGKFKGAYVVATNHHVCPNAIACSASTTPVRFPQLGAAALPIKKLLGTWPEIDLALVEVAAPANDADAQLFAAAAQNFDFNTPLEAGTPLATMGFGIALNQSQRNMMINQDSDCKVFSDATDIRLLADPDDLNPADYKAWSFAHGCEVSHGDSGSAMINRENGSIVGIVWTGKIPKSPEVQNTAFLDRIFAERDVAQIWKELSYAVPATKMKEVFNRMISDGTISDSRTKEIIRAVVDNAAE